MSSAPIYNAIQPNVITFPTWKEAFATSKSLGPIVAIFPWNEFNHVRYVRGNFSNILKTEEHLMISPHHALFYCIAQHPTTHQTIGPNPLLAPFGNIVRHIPGSAILVKEVEEDSEIDEKTHDLKPSVQNDHTLKDNPSRVNIEEDILTLLPAMFKADTKKRQDFLSHFDEAQIIRM